MSDERDAKVSADMSPEAIMQRLRDAAQLNLLGVALSRGRLVPIEKARARDTEIIATEGHARKDAIDALTTTG